MKSVNRITICILLLGLNPVSTFGQCDTNKIIKRNDEILELAYSKPDQALEQVQLQIQKCKNCNYPKGEALAYIRKGIAYEIKSDFKQAIIAYEAGKKIAQTHKIYSAEGSCYNNIGLIYWNQKKHKAAIEQFQKAQIIFKKSNKPEYSYAALNNIGLIMEELEEYKLANKYYLEAIKGYEKLGLKTTNEYAQALGNIGNNYLNLSKGKKGESYLKEAIRIFKKNKNDWNLAQAISNLAAVYWEDKNDTCIQLLLHSRELSKSIGNQFSYAQSTKDAGKWYKYIGENEKAITCFTESYLISKELDDVKTTTISADFLVDLYLMKGDTKNAMKFKKIYDVSKEKLAKYNSSLETKRLDVLYSIKEEKEKTKAIQIQLVNSELEKENNRFYSIVIVLILLLFVAIIVLNFRRKTYKKNLQTQQELFEVKNEERKRISYDLHDMVGSQLSFVVNNLEMIHLKNKEEERIKKTYEMSKSAITSLRDTVWSLHAEELTSENFVDRMKSIVEKWFDNNQVKITFHSNLQTPPSQFNSTQSLHIMRIYQEIISNIYKHAYATEVQINFLENSTFCDLTISDNGNGILEENKEAFHYGLKSMQERANKINGKLTIDSNPTKKGVLVQLTWPK